MINMHTLIHMVQNKYTKYCDTIDGAVNRLIRIKYLTNYKLDNFTQN